MSIFDGYIGNDRSTLAKDLRTQGAVRENNSFSGQSLVEDYDRFTKQILSPDGTTTDFTLSEICKDAKSVLVVNDDVVQEPETTYTVSGNSISFTAAPSNGSELFVIYLGRIQQISTVADNSFTNSQIESIDVNKVFGTFTSNVDGSNLTNMTAAGLAKTKSASDPTATTNPSSTGHVWVNTTTGETYICTDATTDANTWANVGEGSGSIPFYSFQGTVSGYTCGGHDGNGSINVIEKFSLTSDGNGTDVSDLTTNRYGSSSQKSSTHGYNSAGYVSGVSDVIDKFSFAAGTDATDVGDVTVARQFPAGQSSTTHGYTSGGNPDSNVIDKFSFSEDGNSTDVGDLTVSRKQPSGQSSTTHGYTSGGHPFSDVIDKFTFSADNNATDVGDMTVSKEHTTGQSSTTHGYISGGSDGSVFNVIEKFSFATDGNATDVGDLTVGRKLTSGQSSSTHGYTSGGNTGSSDVNVIDKFSFASDENATDIGDLTIVKSHLTGTQY